MNKAQKHARHLCLFGILLVSAGNAVFGQAVDGAMERTIDALFSSYNANTPGVAIAIVKDGKVVLSKGYGSANLEYGIPITPRTVFHVASVSKQFTAFSIYLLEKQGKISFEDDIRKYVPEMPDLGRPVKIRHLLAHTSGIRDQWALLTLAGWRMDDVITTEHILKILSRQKELNFEPGTAFSYSNSGYTLLAEVVRRVSGQTFAAFTRRNIFEPLGMTATQFYEDFNQIVKNRAYSYEKENNTYIKKNLNYSNAGATSLLTTAEDLAKWALNFEHPVVGDTELIARFNAPSLLDNGQPVVYAVLEGETNYHGKGQILRNYRGVNLWNHGGHDAGFRAYLVRFPDDRLSIITLSNDEHYEILKTGLTIAGYYLKGRLNPRSTPDTPAGPNEARKTAETRPADLKSLEGEFHSQELATTYRAKAAAGKLILMHDRLSDIELSEGAKDTFQGRIEFLVTVKFTRNSNQMVTGFTLSNFGATAVRFEKLR
ncbi:serine hydrolase domain-containing protein [uncultured Paludibaculum sp.]|uniref:serine hydrolase domain-containing protein n=1 Tax=uncultured Paludibaculum sp. TaxID=1765020 RepID=UPI002AAB7B97|nr:serine hydrolase domain-containing protein [uncultured Paludibaculum sp.]